MNKISWDETFMGLAKVYAARSKDKSSQIGAVIIGPNNEQRSGGYNGMPRGIDDDIAARHVRPAKYDFFEHAERNALYNAARIGTAVDGCRMYVSGMTPCTDCARGIIQSGIKMVIVETFEVPERWKDNMRTALEMLEEAGVIVKKVQGNNEESGIRTPETGYPA